VRSRADSNSVLSQGFTSAIPNLCLPPASRDASDLLESANPRPSTVYSTACSPTSLTKSSRVRSSPTTMTLIYCNSRPVPSPPSWRVDSYPSTSAESGTRAAGPRWGQAHRPGARRSTARPGGLPDPPIPFNPPC
jgi:hypothetical protein